MKTTIYIKTWSCPNCGYMQDFEPTQENQNKYFNSDKQFKLNNVMVNECPSCKLKGVVSLLQKEIDNKKKSTITIIGEEDIETEIEKIEQDATKNGGEKIKTKDKDDYRAKRIKDIQDAILEARKYEDK